MDAKQLIDQVLRGKDSREVVDNYRESVRRKRDGTLEESFAAIYYNYHDRPKPKATK